MTLKSLIASPALERLLSPQRRLRHHERYEKKRQKRGRPAVIEYFHQSDDPYSHLMLQLLPRLQEQYAVEFKPWLVGPPPDWAAPERGMLVDWSRRDAASLADHLGLAFARHHEQPQAAAVKLANAALADAIDRGRFFEESPGISDALWRGRSLRSCPADGAQAAVDAGNARRQAAGHYLGATLFYGGEWYWGPDRLHYLERRLQDAGLSRTRATGDLLIPAQSSPAPPGNAHGRELHFFLSFRSPYSYLAAPRVFELARSSNASLKLRFVLPMVMRGLPVPRAKTMYIMTDVAREAARLGMPFGRIADPLGKPVERGYSLLPWARDEGRGEEYCLAFLRGVWSQGIDAGSDRGIRRIVESAGLPWARARAHLDTDTWRAEAEANRREMVSLGLWGVPSFRVGDTAVWGQDRLWQVEAALSDPQ
ncbi:DsbA family protein [Chromatocurvus halotolerans]|uniref:2-hydroxychromene-2-carboxylate isomerase n=1 Tax=Chromatocurvus halotolerans TaxID=1132028 RepID=A0A4R2KYU5_9GAMM|nr:DsbA family protein [Chromatocurvus halotolerans]TCO78332.1 2-hydroxychromene-2-carboxylate isomerase [Chromatocurvus halotolerans]